MSDLRLEGLVGFLETFSVHRSEPRVELGLELLDSGFGRLRLLDLPYVSSGSGQPLSETSLYPCFTNSSQPFVSVPSTAAPCTSRNWIAKAMAAMPSCRLLDEANAFAGSRIQPPTISSYHRACALLRTSSGSSVTSAASSAALRSVRAVRHVFVGVRYWSSSRVAALSGMNLVSLAGSIRGHSQAMPVGSHRWTTRLPPPPRIRA